jgi:hypothetical protein
MSEPILSSSSSAYSTRSSSIYHPHYFTTFQKYCCGPKAISTMTTQQTDHLPISNRFKERSIDLIQHLNSNLVENLRHLIRYTSVIPQVFLDSKSAKDITRYLVDKSMLNNMTDACVINWIEPVNRIYPIRTSGKNIENETREVCSCNSIR